MDDSDRGIRIHRPPKELLDMGEWFPLANAYVDQLLANLGPTDFVVLIAIKRRLHGFNRSRGRVSQSEVMHLTGLSRRAVQQSLARLVHAEHLIITERGTGRRSTEYRINEKFILPWIATDSRGALGAPLDDHESVEAHQVHPTGAPGATLGGNNDSSTSMSKDNKKDIEKDISESDSFSSLSRQLIESWPAIQKEMAAQTTEATYHNFLKALRPEGSRNGHVVLRCPCKAFARHHPPRPEGGHPHSIR
jgi:hypothetical protein